MRITPAQAAVLSTRERQLVETTGPYEVRQLATLIRRIRELRDKQRDLVQRQRIAATTRSRSKESATVARTVKKEQIFSRALEHFEGQLQKINSECTAAMQELSLSGRRAPRKAAATGSTGRAAASRTAGTRSAGAKSAGRKTAAGRTAAKKPGADRAATRAAATKTATVAGRGPRGGKAARGVDKARTRAQAAR